MQRYFSYLCFLILAAACNSSTNQSNEGTEDQDALFNAFQPAFLDAYWKENPSASIFAGYGKYYDDLVIPDSNSFLHAVSFSKQWLDSLHAYAYGQLSDDNKINYSIIQNQLQGTIWYIDSLKSQQRDPSSYNLGGECYYLLTRNYAPLTQRLQTLSTHIQHAGDYYAAAQSIIDHPTKEYTTLAIQQNEGSVDVFGAALEDSIKASSLTGAEKDTLHHRIAATVTAIRNYVVFLKKISADKNYAFSNFRIGKILFEQKFKYDLVTDYTAEQMFTKADSAKHYYHREMYKIADRLWPKYFSTAQKPADSLTLIKNVLDKLSLNHASPQTVVDTATKLVHDLERFIIEKELFNYDTSYPLKVRVMPAFMAGVSLANAEQLPPYQKSGITYYNIMDLSKMPVADAESELREYNTYSLQFLSMHEAMPGHCMQGVYNNKSGSIIKSVFQNGPMVEGWAVYCEQMMMENGWGNNSPELWLVLYKWRLRECSNVLIDYGIQCLNYSESDVNKLLKNETFQEDAQIKEKYHRATVSQVQLCSYFTGLVDILSLREAYKNKTGSNYSLKDFHEKFLSYGSAPVKYIREVMLK
ncbi:MAG TPA: DUF885 domain-containing protein [Parafilimonas sp.]|nr:DUF885 domain-containing protein [Parafilimonas sp.]